MGGVIRLSDTFKKHSYELGKTMAPEETVNRFRARLEGLDLDILEETVRIDGGRLDIPVFFSLCGKDSESVIGTRKQMGKGGTVAQAEASAVMELAERFSLFAFKSDPGNFETAPHGAIASRAVSLETIRKSVNDENPDADAELEFFSRVPFRWVSGSNLTTGKEALIPFDWFFALNEYNGSASGNCLEEAVLQAVCEVVERHVSSVVSRTGSAVPAIDPESVTDPMALELLSKFHRAGIRVFLSDMTLDTGIPTVGALAYDPETFPAESEIVWTAGTSPDPQKALVRALTEVAQLSGDFNSCSNYVASGLPKLNSIEEASFFMDAPCTVPVTSLPDLSDENMRVEILRCVESLRAAGLHVLIVDVTHPKFGIPAVYAVLPGARFRERTDSAGVGMFTAKLISERMEPGPALSLLGEMDRLVPGKYYTRFFMGLAHLALDQPRQALSCLEEAVDGGPHITELPDIYSYQGVCLKEMGDYRGALEILKKAEMLDRERTDVYNLMGFCHFMLKEHEDAIDCFRKVLALNPGSGIDYANIASNYRDMGDVNKAVRYYRMALELDPELDFARENLLRLGGSESEACGPAAGNRLYFHGFPAE